MKVLWLSHFVPYPPAGGNKQRSYHLIRELAKGAEVHLVTIDPGFPAVSDEVRRERERAFLEFCASYREFALPTSRNRKMVTALGNLPSKLPVTTPLIHSPGAAAHVRAVLAEDGFDFVHLDTIDLVGYADALGETPIVLTHHNVESSLMFRYAGSMKNPAMRFYVSLQAKRIRRLEQSWCPRAVMNSTVSDLDNEELSEMCPGARFRVVTNGVDVGYFHPITDPGDREPPTLMWAGPMDWYPNRDAIRYLLTEIWPVVAEKKPDARLLLVGKHPPEITAENPAGDRIETPGFVPDVREYMKRAHVYVVPIRVGGGTRLKILDSMSSAKAIVTTSIGCEGLRVEDGVHLMRADDAKTFVEKVLHLIDEAGTRENLGANGRALVEKTYSWDVVGEIMRDVYRESHGLVAGRGGSGG